MEPQFLLRSIIRSGSKDDSRASYRLVTSYEARSHLQQILHGCPPEVVDEKIRLKNGYFTRDGVETCYEPGITMTLVTPTSYSNPAGQMLTEEDWRIAMTYACENDDLQEVEGILKDAGPDILKVRLPHQYRGTALHVCALFNSTETLERLLHVEGTNPSALDSYSETTLHSAAYTGSVGAVKLILATEESKHMLNAQNCYGNTPLVHSVRYGHPEVCKLLLDTAGIQPDIQCEGGNTALHRAVTNAKDWKMVDMILSHPTAAETLLVDKRNTEAGQTALHCSVYTGQVEICSRLLQAGASLILEDNQGKTPLQLACEKPPVLPEFLRWCNFETLLTVYATNKLLANRKLASGLTPLHIAATLSNAEWTQVFIRNEACLDLRNDDGDTCLHMAVKRNNLEVFKCLLSLLQEDKCTFHSGMTPQQWLSMQNSRTGNSALHIAIRQSKEMALALINKRGAFVDVQNKISETPLHIAAREGNLEVVQRLLSRDQCALSPKIDDDWYAWVRMCDSEGGTALHEAVRAGREDVVDEILKYHGQDADINQLLEIRDLGNRTALYWALQLPQPEQSKSMFAKLMASAKGDKTKVFLLWSLGSMSDLGQHPAANEMLQARQNNDSFNMSYLLEKATESKDLQMAALLLSEGADVTTLKDKDACTWLCENLCDKASDRPAALDTLDRKPLVDGIAALLLSPFTATPITLGIYGEWGMGKSTVMLQVEESLLEMSANQTLSQLPGQARSQVVKGLHLDKDTSSDVKIPYRREYHKLFKHLALARRSTNERPSTQRVQMFRLLWTSSHKEKRVDKSLSSLGNATRKDGSLKEAQNTTAVLGFTTKKVEAPKLGEIPSILTVKYNAWHYQDKNEASAGLAIQISKEIENAMSRAQWLRMCWIYSWQSKPRDIFLQILLPLFILAVATFAALILWKVAPLKTIYKAISLPATFLAALLVLFHSWTATLVPVAEKILSYVQTPDHRPTLGYQHKVIQDIQFLKEQLCTPPNNWWKFVGWFVIPSVKYDIKGTRVRTQAPAIVDNLRIVVFIDDLDRCHQPIILELLCVINLILAQCEINVILGIEKSMVHRAVTQVFLNDSNDPKLAEAFADKYLQKIIQLPIQLPNLGQHELASFLEGQIGSNQNIKNVNIDHDMRRNDDSSASVRQDGDNRTNENNEEFPSSQAEFSPSRAAANGDQLIIPITESNSNDMDRNRKLDVKSDTDAGNGNDSKTSIHNGSTFPGRDVAATAIPLFLATYSQPEAQMLHNLVPMAQSGDRRLPREWKRFLNYHRLASNILLQDRRMKTEKLKAWRTKLILWIFISWNWTKEMNILIKKWDDLISQIHKGQGKLAHARSRPAPANNEETASNFDSLEFIEDFVARNMLQGEKSALEVKPDIMEDVCHIQDELSLGDVIDLYISQEIPQPMAPKVKEAEETTETREVVYWQRFRKCVEEHGDLSMEYVDAFQQFRFYCELDHLKMPGRHVN